MTATMLQNNIQVFRVNLKIIMKIYEIDFLMKRNILVLISKDILVIKHFKEMFNILFILNTDIKKFLKHNNNSSVTTFFFLKLPISLIFIVLRNIYLFFLLLIKVKFMEQ